MTDTISSLPQVIPFLEAHPSIRAVIFDFGGTLDTDGDHWSRVILDGYHAAGLFPDPESFRRAYIAAERTLGKGGIIDPSDNFDTLMRKKLQLQRASIGYSQSLDPVARYCTEVARTTTRRALPVLEALAARGPLALVSNFYGNLQAVTTDFGIAHCFDVMIDSAIVGLRKPDPAIFSLAMKALAALPPSANQPQCRDARSVRPEEPQIQPHRMQPQCRDARLVRPEEPQIQPHRMRPQCRDARPVRPLSGGQPERPQSENPLDTPQIEWRTHEPCVPTLQPEQILVVGDSEKNDIIPARTLGFHTLHLTGRPYLPTELSAPNNSRG